MKSRMLSANLAFPLAPERSNILACWDFELEKGEAVAPHSHDDLEEIYIILEGIGKMVVGESTNTVFAGDVIYIPPRNIHFLVNEVGGKVRSLTITCRARPEGRTEAKA